MRVDVISHKFVSIYSFKQKIIKIIKAVVYFFFRIDKFLTVKITNDILGKYADEGFTLLDVGCGMGDFLIDISGNKKFSNSMCIGVDSSKQMINHSYVHAEGKSNKLVFLIGDITALPFKTSSLDLVWLNWIIHHLSEDVEKKALAEVLRVAKKSVVIRDVQRNDYFWGKIVSLYWKYFDGGYKYRSIEEWVDYIGKANIINKYKASYPDFIIEISPAKKE